MKFSLGTGALTKRKNYIEGTEMSVSFSKTEKTS